MKSQLEKFGSINEDFDAMDGTKHFHYCQAYCVSSLSEPASDAEVSIDVQMANECSKAGIIFA